MSTSLSPGPVRYPDREKFYRSGYIVPRNLPIGMILQLNNVVPVDPVQMAKLVHCTTRALRYIMPHNVAATHLIRRPKTFQAVLVSGVEEGCPCADSYLHVCCLFVCFGSVTAFVPRGQLPREDLRRAPLPPRPLVTPGPIQVVASCQDAAWDMVVSPGIC